MGMIVEATDVAELREMVESEFEDTCRIERRTGETTDPVTLKVTPVMALIYEGECLFKMTTSLGINPADDRRIVGDQKVTITQGLLKVPVNAVGINTDDVLTLLTSTYDPELPGLVLRIDGPFFGQTHGVCRRFWVEVPS